MMECRSWWWRTDWYQEDLRTNKVNGIDGDSVFHIFYWFLWNGILTTRHGGPWRRSCSNLVKTTASKSSTSTLSYPCCLFSCYSVKSSIMVWKREAWFDLEFEISISNDEEIVRHYTKNNLKRWWYCLIKTIALKKCLANFAETAIGFVIFI